MTQPPFVTSYDISALIGVVHGFFGRAGGVSRGLYDSLNTGYGSKDDRPNVARNRARIAAAFGRAPEALLTVHQSHTPDVIVATKPWRVPEDAPKADAIVTKNPDILLGIMAADCAPVLLADPVARVIGVAHAGWAGARGGVVEATMDAMIGLGASLDRMAVAIGPCIGPKSYEVGPEFRTRFLVDDRAHGRHFVAGPGDRWLFDLPGYIDARLRKLGVAAVWTGHDTLAQSDRFFSYRCSTLNAEPDYGRNLSVIGLGDLPKIG